MKPRTHSRRLIDLRQLCSIARTVLEADPTIDDYEWKERTKLLVAQQGYRLERSDLLADALTQVERALEKTRGPRPAPMPPPAFDPSKRTAEAVDQVDPPWSKRTPKPQGWTSVQQLANPKPRGAGSTSSPEATVKPVRPLTLRQAERMKALRIVLQAIDMQTDRCDALEREPEDAK